MMIDRSSDEFFMGEALRQARLAWETDEVPVGAVMVHQQRIVARAFNQVERLKDATAHAEMLAITQAAHAVGDWRLTGMTLFVTKEPCPMCAGALVLSRVARVVFGVADPRGGGAGSVFDITGQGGLNHKVSVVGGVRAQECRQLLQEFFVAKRQAGQL
jgi:tRNA(adenine34) deaminase